jgi:hypothetical protein
MKTMETTEEVSSRGVEKHAERHKCQRSAPFAREKPRRYWKKGLANLWRRKKFTKKVHAGRGQEIKLELSVKSQM